jgi:hypothetical protein
LEADNVWLNKLSQISVALEFECDMDAIL